MYGGLASFRDLQIYMQQVVGSWRLEWPENVYPWLYYSTRLVFLPPLVCWCSRLGLFSSLHSSFPEFSSFFCSVCPASPIATGLIVASYSTWHQPRHTSRDKSVQAFPCFLYCKRQKLGVEAWELGYTLGFIIVLGSSSCHHCSVDVLVCPATSM